MTTWQPIETAPKDGTHILIWEFEGNAAVVECYYSTEDGWEGWIYADTLLADSCPDGPDADFWMPLPEPPK